MQGTLLTAYTRKRCGKEENKRLRREGSCPAVLYGGGEKDILLKVNTSDIEHIIVRSGSGEHSVISLAIDGHKGKTVTTLLKEVQHDPVTEHILHVDFLRLKPGQKIYFKLPISYVGEAAGVKAGGLLTEYLHEIEVYCDPLQAPDTAEIDVSSLEIGDVLHIEDISIPNVEIRLNPEIAVVSVIEPKIYVEAVSAEEAAEVEKEEEKKEVAEGEEKQKEEAEK